MLLIALAACVSHDAPPLPDGLAPLEANAITHVPDGEVLAVRSGHGDGYAWAHGLGRVDASPDDVWAALQDPDVVVDRRRVASWSTTWDVNPSVDVSLRVHHRVVDVVTVEYDIDWRHGLAEGARPEGGRVYVRWDKTAGSPLIARLQGSIVLTDDGDGGSVVDYVEHLSAATQGPDVVARYLLDLHASVTAAAHGEPLPKW